MFGFTRARMDTLDGDGHRELRRHYCGTCTALSRGYGYLFAAINGWDARLTSLLVDSQMAKSGEEVAVRCPARLYFSKRIALESGLPTRYAAAVMMFLLDEKLQDNRQDDGSRMASLASRIMGNRIVRARRFLAELQFPFDRIAVLKERQRAVERYEKGLTLRAVTAPVSEATALLFSHFALVAGAPQNAGGLSRIGSAFGAVCEILDASCDFERDKKKQKFNAIAATLPQGEDNLPLRTELLDGIWTFVATKLASIRRAIRSLELYRNRTVIENIVCEGLYDTAHDTCLTLNPHGHLRGMKVAWICPCCGSSVKSRFCSFCGTSADGESWQHVVHSAESRGES